MTAAQIAVYSTAIRAKAEALLEKRQRWARGEARVNGALIGVVLFSSSRKPKNPNDPHIVYVTICTGLACNCPAAQKSASGRCCHRLAAALDTEMAQSRQPQYDDSGDDLGLVSF